MSTITSPDREIASVQPRSNALTLKRNEALRSLYIDAALPAIARLLGAIDRNPYRPTYGCLDRQFWHYRTSDFPSAMYEEGLLPLALVYKHPLPNNTFYQNERLRELIVAGLRFAARASHADGSCDDYYPFERALGAAVFSLGAAAHCHELLELDDAIIRQFLQRRARWLVRHDESGDLTNHQALAAVALLRVARITGDATFEQAAKQRIDRVLQWQSSEGWFREYGGADLGYQTVTIDALAKYRELTGNSELDAPLQSAIRFTRQFLHPDNSYGGPYGSRGTYHFYPHGMELLSAKIPEATELAEGFLNAMASGRIGHFDDDRMFAHRPGNLLEAYLAWQPHSAYSSTSQPHSSYFPGCGLAVIAEQQSRTIVSTARGGTFTHFAEATHRITDCGVVLETTAGRVAVANTHTLANQVAGPVVAATTNANFVGQSLSVTGRMQWWKPETVTPLKSIILRVGMLTVGRWCRDLVRKVLQRRLITGRCEAPIQFRRNFRWLPPQSPTDRPQLEVTDELQLLDPRIRVRRLSVGGEFEPAYVAASAVYQPSVLRCWDDLANHLDELNRTRRLRIVRIF